MVGLCAARVAAGLLRRPAQQRRGFFVARVFPLARDLRKPALAPNALSARRYYGKGLKNADGSLRDPHNEKNFPFQGRRHDDWDVKDKPRRKEKSFVSSASFAKKQPRTRADEDRDAHSLRLSMDRYVPPKGGGGGQIRDNFALNNKIVDCTVPGEILSLFVNNHHDFSDVNIATSINRLAKIKMDQDAKASKYPMNTGDQRFHMLFDHAAMSVMRALDAPAYTETADGAPSPRGPPVEFWAPRHLANVCWGVAHLAPEPESIPERVKGPRVAIGDSYKVRVKIAAAAHKLFDAVALVALKKMEGCGPQELSIIAWSLSKIGAKHGKLFDAIASQTTAHINEFGGTHLAQIAWAFASHGGSHSALFEAVAGALLSKLSSFNAQELADTVWAYSKAGVNAPELFNLIAAEATLKSGGFTPSALASTVHSNATVGFSSPKLFDALAEEAVKTIGRFEAADLVQLVWGYSTAKHASPQLYAAAADRAVSKMDNFDVQGLTDVVWAYAAAGVEALDLFERVSLEAPRKLHHATPHGLATLAWAFAKVGFEASLLFDALGREALEKLATFDDKDLETLQEAFKEQGLYAPKLLNAIDEAQEARRIAKQKGQYAGVWRT